jgi:hypothetical protein
MDGMNNMNKKILSFVLMCISFAPVSWAQTGNETGNVQDSPAIYIMDGENPSYVWGRQETGGKIVIGLTEEGFYELRGDSAIWHINHPRLGDFQVAHIVRDDETGANFIVMGAVMEKPKKPNIPNIPDNPDHPNNLGRPDIENTIEMDVIGIYSPENAEILDKNKETVAMIDRDDKVENSQGKTFLQFNSHVNPVDKNLIAFFFLYHYQVLHSRKIK